MPRRNQGLFMFRFLALCLRGPPKAAVVTDSTGNPVSEAAIASCVRFASAMSGVVTVTISQDASWRVLRSDESLDFVLYIIHVSGSELLYLPIARLQFGRM